MSNLCFPIYNVGLNYGCRRGWIIEKETRLDYRRWKQICRKVAWCWIVEEEEVSEEVMPYENAGGGVWLRRKTLWWGWRRAKCRGGRRGCPGRRREVLARGARDTKKLSRVEQGETMLEMAQTMPEVDEEVDVAAEKSRRSVNGPNDHGKNYSIKSEIKILHCSYTTIAGTTS